ncbi:MAG TPA: hypothetical protein DDZ74_00825 [Pseudomonas sp.]|nr:hypothetical protein [Pseudomonas sp.]
MRTLGWVIAVVVVSVGAGLLGLTIGIYVNPAATVKFVPELGSNTWAALGSWVGATATFTAVGVALHLSGRDDAEELHLHTLSHEKAGKSSNAKVTFMAACKGRVPTTILFMAIRNSSGGLLQLSQITASYDYPRFLQRGEMSQAVIDDVAMKQISAFLSSQDQETAKGKFVVQTALKEYEIDISPDAIRFIASYAD